MPRSSSAPAASSGSRVPTATSTSSRLPIAIVTPASAAAYASAAASRSGQNIGRQSRSSTVSRRRPRASSAASERRAVRLVGEAGAGDPEDRARRGWRRGRGRPARCPCRAPSGTVEDQARILGRVELAEHHRRRQRRRRADVAGVDAESLAARRARSRRTRRRRASSPARPGGRTGRRRRRRWWPCRRSTCERAHAGDRAGLLRVDVDADAPHRDQVERSLIRRGAVRRGRRRRARGPARTSARSDTSGTPTCQKAPPGVQSCGSVSITITVGAVGGAGAAERGLEAGDVGDVLGQAAERRGVGREVDARSGRRACC